MMREMLFSTYESVIDMLCLKKAECRETFPKKFLDMNLKYYDGVSMYKEWGCYSRRHFPAGSIPYTHLPKPPVMNLLNTLKDKACQLANKLVVKMRVIKIE